MTPTWTVAHADMRDLLPKLPAESCDACVCDPPYELGFMSKAWDKRGIAFDPETWRAVFRVLKPGGYLLAFGGTRTFHRIAVAIEDAGFEIRDSLAWMYGSGFPKSLNVSKGIDKAAGAEREAIGKHPAPCRNVTASPALGGGFQRAPDVTAPATSEAQRWDGWGTALKPAFEPIIVARKPLRGTVAANVLEHGTGAINVDGCRVAGAYDTRDRKTQGGRSMFGTGAGGGAFVPTAGRWPPNVLLQHAEGCRYLGQREIKANPTWDTPNRNTEPPAFTGETVSTVRHGDGETEAIELWECVDGCPVAELDAQSGAGAGASPPGAVMDHPEGRKVQSVSRYFPRFHYCPKASRKERDAGLEHREPLTDGQATDRQDGSAGTCHPRAGAGWTGGMRNPHPTVKPIALLRWLVRLVAPPGAVVLDPFAGAGSCGIAVIREGGGRRYLGVELLDSEAEPYVTIARDRIAAAERDKL